MAHRAVNLTTQQTNEMIALYADNFSDEDIATYFGVHVKALRNWLRRRENIEVRERIKQTKIKRIAAIRRSLFTRATGQPYKEGRPKVVEVKNGKSTVVDEGEPAQIAVSGNLQAIEYWLHNCDDKKEWKDIKQLQVSGAGGESLFEKIPHMSKSELVKIIAEGINDGIELPDLKRIQEVKAISRSVNTEYQEVESDKDSN